ncbi:MULTISPECIES: helix-turn-helix transcriptional regulator [unclassified Streptomyces]|uniref:helix-turn-helix domain-containing protein n=1 Tax=unclassified Streptomyces TaxID=2593676 RepID=UPI0033F9F919
MTDQTTAMEQDMAREIIPRDHLASGTWPTGPLTADVPPGARLGHATSGALATAMQEQGVSSRELARRAGLTHPTVVRVLEGQRLPSTHTLLLLETALGTPLWPATLYRDSPGN